MARWFDRQFSFGLSLSAYPEVVKRLRNVPPRLQDLVRDIPQEALSKRDGEAWSIQEHAGHLLDLEPLGMKRLDDFAQGREVLSAADLENRKTWEANHNARRMSDILREFGAARNEFVERLEKLDEVFIHRVAIHPRLKKPMRVVDLLEFTAEHDDHHLTQITQLVRKWRSE